MKSFLLILITQSLVAILSCEIKEEKDLQQEQTYEEAFYKGTNGSSFSKNTIRYSYYIDECGRIRVEQIYYTNECELTYLE